MANDKAMGSLLLAGSIIILLVYLWLVLGPYWWLAIEIVGTSIVVGVLGIIGWIGWTLATTPTPPTIEDMSPQGPSSEAEKKKAEPDKKDEERSS